MEHFSKIERRDGVDVGFNGSNIEPLNRVGCVGKSGIDKKFKLEQVMSLAYELEPKANIIVKAGKNAKWYLKRCDPADIEARVQQHAWMNSAKRCSMWIIEWKN